MKKIKKTIIFISTFVMVTIISLSCKKLSDVNDNNPKILSLKISKDENLKNLLLEVENGLINLYDPTVSTLKNKDRSSYNLAISKVKSFDDLENVLSRYNLDKDGKIIDHWKKLDFFIKELATNYPELKNYNQVNVNQIMNDAVKLRKEDLKYERERLNIKISDFNILNSQISNLLVKKVMVEAPEDDLETPCMTAFRKTATEITRDFNFTIHDTCLWGGIVGVFTGGVGTITYLACVGAAESNYNYKMNNAWRDYRDCMGYPRQAD